MSAEQLKEFLDKLSAAIVGKKIKRVRYMMDSELKRVGWEGQGKPIVFQLEGGILLYPSADDEGNGPGAIFTTIPDLDTIGVI